MKSIIYISLFTLLGGIFSFPTTQTPLTPEREKAKVILLMDDYICSEDQWVYLYGFQGWLPGDERAIFDSAFIPKGQHRIELQEDIPITSEFNVLFSRKGPHFSIPIEPNSCVIMNVEETDGEAFYYKKAIQGKFNNDYYDYWQGTIAYRHKLKDFMAEDKKDSLEYLKAERFKFLTEKLKTAKSGWEVNDARIMLNVEFPGKSTGTNALAKLIAKKFPQDISLQESVKNKKLVPMSEESKRIGERIFKIREAKSIIDTVDLSLGQQLTVTFPDVTGNKISTSDSDRDYTLIDFWASWCKPCRKESPLIKQAMAKYPGKFNVYAVSIDANRQAWQKAITEDSTQMFKHLIGTYPNGQPSTLLRQLNINAIPANFLLDKSQRIIAKDLRGEELIQVLDSLMTE